MPPIWIQLVSLVATMLLAVLLPISGAAVSRRHKAVAKPDPHCRHCELLICDDTGLLQCSACCRCVGVCWTTGAPALPLVPRPVRASVCGRTIDFGCGCSHPECIDWDWALLQDQHEAAAA